MIEKKKQVYAEKEIEIRKRREKKKESNRNDKKRF
jgi:hypothetical protein